jgi:DNA polymerase I-like protein with 3'-5' exonuclease and polymerase domains
MILTVHDSIIFEIKDGEEFLVEELAQIMREAYPYRILPMDVSVEVGEKNMAETRKV